MNYVGVVNKQSIKVHMRKRPIRSELDQGSIETIHVQTVVEISSASGRAGIKTKYAKEALTICRQRIRDMISIKRSEI